MSVWQWNQQTIPFPWHRNAAMHKILPTIHNGIYQQSFPESPFKRSGYRFLRSHRFSGASSASFTQTTSVPHSVWGKHNWPKVKSDRSRTKTVSADGWAHTGAHLCADGWKHIYLLIFKLSACPMHLAMGNLHLIDIKPTVLSGFHSSVNIGQI